MALIEKEKIRTCGICIHRVFAVISRMYGTQACVVTS